MRSLVVAGLRWKVISLSFLVVVLIAMAFPRVAEAAAQEVKRPDHGERSSRRPADNGLRDEDPRFVAPKAQLAKVVASSLRKELGAWSRENPAKAAMGYLLAFVALPLFLALDFANGRRRGRLPWGGMAVTLSWLVVPLMWAAGSRARVRESEMSTSEGRGARDLGKP